VARMLRSCGSSGCAKSIVSNGIMVPDVELMTIGAPDDEHEGRRA
jgi:hypothetical protein